MSIKPERKTAENGFTLVEVLLAIGILGFMLTVTYESVSSIIRSKRFLEDEQEIERADQVLMRKLTQEFQLSTTSVPLLPPADDLDHRHHSNENLKGAEGELSNGMPGDTVTFVAKNAGQYFLEGRRSNAGVVQLNYRVMENPDKTGPNGEPIFALVREEVPFRRPYEDAYKQAVRFPLFDSVDGFRVEYFDPEEKKWVRNWGTDPNNGLPAIIRFSIFVQTPLGRKWTISGSAAPRGE